MDRYDAGRSPRRTRERGAAAVEFALVSVILITLMFGILQYGLYFWSAQSGAHAAREAARQAAVGALDCTAFEDAVLDNAVLSIDSTVEATRTHYTDPTLTTQGAPAIGGAVRVAVRFNSIDIGFPLFPFIEDGLVYEEAVARVESITANSGDCA